MEFFLDILYKLLISIIVLILSLIFKPVRKKLYKTRLYKYIMRKLGKEKHKVIVTGNVYHKSNIRKAVCSFEVELPYKDISEHTMPISESNALIINAINKKYGHTFNTSEYWINNVRPRKVTYYNKTESV